MPWVGFEPTISAGERPKTYDLDRAATGTGILFNCNIILHSYGTRIVYAVRRWPKRRYTAHDCKWLWKKSVPLYGSSARGTWTEESSTVNAKRYVKEVCAHVVSTYSDSVRGTWREGSCTEGLRETCDRRFRKRSISFLQGGHDGKLKARKRGGLEQNISWTGSCSCHVLTCITQKVCVFAFGKNTLRNRLYVTDFVIIRNVGDGRIWVVFPYIIRVWCIRHTWIFLSLSARISRILRLLRKFIRDKSWSFVRQWDLDKFVSWREVRGQGDKRDLSIKRPTYIGSLTFWSRNFTFKF